MSDNNENNDLDKEIMQNYKKMTNSKLAKVFVWIVILTLVLGPIIAFFYEILF